MLFPCAHLALPEVAQWEKLRVNGASFVNSLQGYWAELRWLLALPEVARRNQLRGNGASFVNLLQGYWSDFSYMVTVQRC